VGGAWKLNSRSGAAVLGAGLGETGSDGEVGTLNVGIDEGEGKEEGGGNSSKIRGSGRFCWALAGVRLRSNPPPNRSQGIQDAAVTRI